MKKILLGVLLLVSVFSCGDKKDSADGTKTVAEGTSKLIVGASPVPHAEILRQVVDDLKNEGIDLEIVEFDDYILPNTELKSGSLDANYFQHVPYMENFAQENGIDLVSIGSIHVEPLALYSDKVKKIEELKDGAEILIPNDPTNLGRALILLSKNGVIKLEDETKLDSTLENIAENTKNIKFVTLNADQIAPRLIEVDAAIINGNYAINAGLNPVNNSILIEGKDSPYANIIATLKGKENDEKLQKLVKALQSEKIANFIKEKYNGAVIQSF